MRLKVSSIFSDRQSRRVDLQPRAFDLDLPLRLLGLEILIIEREKESRPF